MDPAKKEGFNLLMRDIVLIDRDSNTIGVVQLHDINKLYAL
jgi:hypothetical protein